MEVIEILHKIGYTSLQDHGKDYRTAPLYRQSDNNTSLCINKTSGQWYDFSSRDGGSLLGLVKITLNLPSMKTAQEYLGDSTLVIEVPTKHRYELLETKKFDKNLLFKLKKDHSYWSERGISEYTVDKFQGGTTYNGRMCYRYVFPIFGDNNELIGFSGRRLNDNPDYPKWKILGKKSHFVYPKWDANYHEKAIIVESIGDMLSLAEIGIRNVFVAFGVDVGPKIVERLLRNDTRKIFIVFNNDNGNNNVGNNAAIECKSTLSKYFDPSQIVNIVPPHKDLNEFLLSDRKGFKDFCSEMESHAHPIKKSS